MSKWGILPYIKRVIQFTKFNFNEVLDMPVVTLFYLTCFEQDMDDIQRLEMEKWKRNH